MTVNLGLYLHLNSWSKCGGCPDGRRDVQTLGKKMLLSTCAT